ncbi:hypothetical protein [Halostreptopolyspora alba]|uniref:Uncharacterized protein n=1 Tax=Halostreptopolyspora alba TaxID=2487137 RepID=A0A3N0E665_9ACTN|nr:hypothetical protein EFW17_16395 [Nocardiopsaceae bacterium YIM 96095]
MLTTELDHAEERFREIAAVLEEEIGVAWAKIQPLDDDDDRSSREEELEPWDEGGAPDDGDVEFP